MSALSRLRACGGGCGAAFLPHQKSQQFCSRGCAVRARPARPRRPRPLRTNDQHDRLILRLLDIQPLERRRTKSNPCGGWRFGTKRIGDSLIARLIASGRVEIRGERLHRTAKEAA